MWTDPSASPHAMYCLSFSRLHVSVYPLPTSLPPVHDQSTEVTARLAEGSLREQYEARLAASATENERLRAELHAAREKLAVIGLL